MKKLSINKKLLVLAGFLASIFGGFIGVAPTYAANNYIQISPTTEDYELEPGHTYTGSVRVQNIGDNAFDYKMSAQPFSYNGDNYNITVGKDVKTSVYSEIAEWVTFSKDSGSLEPHTKETINYTIKVPSDAPGGSQYVAIVASLEEDKSSGSDGANIKTISQVTDLIFGKVSGETNECAKIHNNTINTFMFEPPITASSLVEDCGNVHLYATYIMKVYPLFSDTPIYSNEEKPETHVVVPETRRYNTSSWKKEDGAPMMGIFNVEQTVKIGKEVSTVKKLVFIFPLWLLIIFFLLIASIIFWLVSRSRARRESAKSESSFN